MADTANTESNGERQEYDNEMRGVLFKNDKQGVPTRPDWTGQVQIHGDTYRLAAWVKDTRKGKILSISVNEPRDADPVTGD